MWGKCIIMALLRKGYVHYNYIGRMHYNGNDVNNN